jgi:acyl carrier protein
MIEEDVQGRVIAVLKKNRRIGSIPLQLDTRFDQLKLDSLDVICMVFDLEEEFKITIPDNAAQHMRCIGDVVEGVKVVLKGTPPDHTPKERQGL